MAVINRRLVWALVVAATQARIGAVLQKQTDSIRFSE